MASKVFLLLLLGLSLRGEGVWSRQEECTTWPAADSVINVRSLIHSILKGDWERIRLVQLMARGACDSEIKDLIYESLWQEWQQDSQSNDPQKILDFYAQFRYDKKAPTTLRETVHQAFVSRYSPLLSPLFFNDTAEFPEVGVILTLFSGLQRQSLLAELLISIFDDVRSKNSIQTAANRLSNFNASLAFLTWANLQLLNGTDVNSTVHSTLVDNLRHLAKQPNFNKDVPYRYLIQTYELLPTEAGFLDIIRTQANFRMAFYENYFLTRCKSQDYYMCVSYNQSSSFIVKHENGVVHNKTQYSFQNWLSEKYLAIDPNIPNKSEKAKNVKYKDRVQWWNAEQVKDGVALYDAETSSLVLCGNPTSGDDLQDNAYTRRADDFEAYAKECTWIFEDAHVYIS